jgi:hypothetical protein
VIGVEVGDNELMMLVMMLVVYFKFERSDIPCWHLYFWFLMYEFEAAKADLFSVGAHIGWTPGHFFYFYFFLVSFFGPYFWRFSFLYFFFHFRQRNNDNVEQ